MATDEPARDVFAGLSDEQVDRLRSTVVACGADADRVCRWILEATGNETLADLGQWVVDVPFLIAMVLLIAYLVNRYVRKGIHRYLRRLNRRSIAQAVDDPDKSARSTLRMTTASSILASAASLDDLVVRLIAEEVAALSGDSTVVPTTTPPSTTVPDGQ